MQFPIQSNITPLPYGMQTGTALRVDGNAGQIPCTFQFSVVADDGTMLQQGIDAMTDDQWAAYKDQPDGPYILQCVAANEGFTLTS